ncbi:MAG: peptide-methionine (S)-S-oxide reductase MsrA [Candidatus Paceibacterota bacterium]|jgi:peptide-methionine (S)-S-oxide reductase
MPESQTAIFGGGCFWCTEAVFKMLKGVSSVMPGYAGGSTANPTHEEVSTGITGHAEVVEIKYDPSLVKFHDLLTVFFATHNPTTLNRQGNDVGTQYRSVIFYTTENQKKESEEFITELNASAKDGEPVVTEVVPLSNFYDAEDYHKDYYARYKNKNPYCEIVINPKLQKVQEKFANLIQG